MKVETSYVQHYDKIEFNDAKYGKLYLLLDKYIVFRVWHNSYVQLVELKNPEVNVWIGPKKDGSLLLKELPKGTFVKLTQE